MSLPSQHWRAQERTAEFLRALLYGEYKGVSREVREEARACLRHYALAVIEIRDMLPAAEAEMRRRYGGDQGDVGPLPDRPGANDVKAPAEQASRPPAPADPRSPEPSP